MRAYEHLVVGAGVAGLYAALLLARRGKSVRIIERAKRAGGLCDFESFRGLPCDLGSHRLHPSVLDKALYRELDGVEPLLWRRRRGVLLLGGRQLPYPPSALDLVRGLGWRTAATSCCQILAQRLGAGRQRAGRPDAGGWGARRRRGWERERLASSPGQDVGFERFVIERVGEAAYRAFYEPYARKVWGGSPTDLSQSVAKKRVSTTEPWRLLRGLLRSPWRSDDSWFLYPRGGAASLVRYLEGELGRLGVEVETGVHFDPRQDNNGSVLFSGNLEDLGPTELEHRGLYLIYLALPLDRVGQAETYYVPESRYWFGRVSELQNYSPALHVQGETVLCVEIPEGSHGPDLDFAAGRKLTSLMRQLADAHIVPAGAHPIQVRQRFIPRVYPLYRRGWLLHWQQTMDRVAELDRVVPFGRQALFLHSNLDHSTDIAAAAVDHQLSGAPLSRWMERARRYLEIRVRD